MLIGPPFLDRFPQIMFGSDEGTYITSLSAKERCKIAEKPLSRAKSELLLTSFVRRFPFSQDLGTTLSVSSTSSVHVSRSLLSSTLQQLERTLLWTRRRRRSSSRRTPELSSTTTSSSTRGPSREEELSSLSECEFRCSEEKEAEADKLLLSPRVLLLKRHRHRLPAALPRWTQARTGPRASAPQALP